jgi:tRNA-dihydrouridine synthase A
MHEPDLVAACVAAMHDATGVPVTVKTRIGVDDHDGYEFLADFVARVAAAGCRSFVVHARKAILAGLSPRQNREIPPLRYDVVYRLKREFPDLEVIVNGGIGTLAAIAEHLRAVDGVMLGRKAADDPYFLAAVQGAYLGGAPTPTRELVVRCMYDYTRRAGVRVHHVTRHMLGLYRGMPGARGWRRFLAEHACRHDAAPELLVESLAALGTARA